MKEIVVFFGVGILILIVGCTGIDMSSSNARNLNIADFGAIPDDGKDDTHAVLAALDEIRNVKGCTSLNFTRGKYDFFSTSASRVNYPVTAVHKQWDFVTPFHLDGLENLTIDGGGSTFIMHGRMTPFVLNACRNVKVTRLSIEHLRPSVFELKVVEKGNSEIEYEAIGNDKFLIENNQLVWLDADDIRQIPNVFQYYDPVNDITRRCPDPLKNAVSITKINDNRIRARYEPGAGTHEKIRSGEFFQFRFGIRNQSGVVVYESQKISFEDLNVYSWNGLGFVCQFCRDLSFKNLRLEPNSESGRTNAGFADAIQILASGGDILIEDNRFVGLHDDHINIYGQMMKVEKIVDERMIEAVFTSNETEGFLNFHEGDKVIFRNPNTLEASGEFYVVDSKLLNDKTLHIKLNKEVQLEYQDYWIENLTWIPDKVTIRGNFFGRVPTRSILMYVARNAVIENNSFHRIPMAAILMKSPDQHYALQNHMEKLIIRNNVFYKCEGALINSNPQVKELSANANLYGILEMKDNLIIMSEEMSSFIDIRGFSKVNIGVNRIELTKPQSDLAKFTDCSELSLSRQMILGAQDTLKAELIRVPNYTSEGWKVKRIN